jgi:hypothetical protein
LILYEGRNLEIIIASLDHERRKRKPLSAEGCEKEWQRFLNIDGVSDIDMLDKENAEGTV